MIHVLDYQTDRILGWLDNKPDSALFWNDVHRQLLRNNEETFDFTMQADVPEAVHFAEMNRVIIPDEDGHFIEFIIGWTDQFSDKTKEVRTLASYTELAKQKILDPVILEGQTVETALDHILNGTEWQRGITEFSGTRKIEFNEHTDALRALRQVASVFELELRFRVEMNGNRITGRYVDLIEKVGQNTKKEIELGKDLIGVTRKEDSTNIVTAMIGLGPEREDGTRLIVRVEDNEALQRWGRNGRHLWGLHEPTTEDNMTEARLRQLTEAQLKKQINTVVEYEVQQASIEHIFGYEHEKVRIGDSVRVKDTSYTPPLYLDARIISVERSISDKSKKKFILGDFIEHSEEDIMATFKKLRAILNQKASQGDIQAVLEYTEQLVETAENNAKDFAEVVAIEKANEAEIAAKTYADDEYSGTKTRVRDWQYGDTPFLDGSKLFVKSVKSDAIDVNDLSAISANLGTVTSGSVKSNTTIDVTTDLRVGNNIYVGNQSSLTPKYLRFNNMSYIRGDNHLTLHGGMLFASASSGIEISTDSYVYIDGASVEIDGRFSFEGNQIQHGQVKGVVGTTSVTFTFPRAFSTTPAVLLQLRSLSGQFFHYYVWQITNTSCTIVYDNTNFNQNAWFWWVAIGGS